MLDLFGHDTVNKNTEKVLLSERELDFVCDAIFAEGELLKELGVNLEKLRSLKNTTHITPIRKEAWAEFAWVFDLGEPAFVTFDTACDVCGADAENLRTAIGREFGDEILLMYESICARIPEKASRFTLRLRHYIHLKIN